MKEWARQEKRIAKRTGGKQNAGSGSGWRRPNDVRTSTELWEMKQTDGKSISIKLEDWEKVRKNAMLGGKAPRMGLQMQGRRLVVMEEDDYFAMVQPARADQHPLVGGIPWGPDHPDYDEMGQ